MRASLSYGLLIPAALPLIADTTAVYPSPDGALRAIVVTTAGGESRTSIQIASNRSLLTRDECSRDGAHGHGVVRAAWTCDSQFLVVSTAPPAVTSLGRDRYGSIRARRTASSNCRSSALLSPADFTLKAPDRVEVPIIGCAGLLSKSRIFGFSLNRFLTTGRLEIPSCSVQ